MTRKSSSAKFWLSDTRPPALVADEGKHADKESEFLAKVNSVAKEAIGRAFSPDQPATLTFDQVVDTIVALRDVKDSNLLSEDEFREIARLIVTRHIELSLSASFAEMHRSLMGESSYSNLDRWMLRSSKAST